MADEKINVNPALPQDGDDTVTRKTIKLRPMAAPGVAPIKPAAAPRPASDTNTGSIDLADDTQTRRTIKLKPLASVMSAKPAAPAPAPAAAPASASAPAAAAKADGDDTVTRKTIKLRPVMTSVASAPAAAPTPAPAPAPAASAPAAEDSGEKTIRIQRPVKPATTGPAVSPRPISAAPTPAAKPAAPVQAVKMPTLKKAPSAPAPTPKATIAPEEQPVKMIMPDIRPGKDKDGRLAIDSFVDEEAAPSKLPLILSIVALILMIYSTLLITVQYLDIIQVQNTAAKVSFMVPGGSK